MKISLVVVLAVGLGGCEAQQLQTGDPSRDGGATDLAVSGDDGGCPAEALGSCPSSDCNDTISPVCIDGVWTCPTNPDLSIDCPKRLCGGALPFGCSCDPASGEIICGYDAGPDTSGDGCPSSADASLVQCVTACNNDGALVPICSAGDWVCPQGSFDVSACLHHPG